MIFYETLMGMSGEKCYTLTADKPADMYVDDQKVTIVYPSGNSLDIHTACIGYTGNKYANAQEKTNGRRGPRGDYERQRTENGYVDGSYKKITRSYL